MSTRQQKQTPDSQVIVRTFTSSQAATAIAQARQADTQAKAETAAQGASSTVLGDQARHSDHRDSTSKGPAGSSHNGSSSFLTPLHEHAVSSGSDASFADAEKGDNDTDTELEDDEEEVQGDKEDKKEQEDKEEQETGEQEQEQEQQDGDKNPQRSSEDGSSGGRDTSRCRSATGADEYVQLASCTFEDPKLKGTNHPALKQLMHATTETTNFHFPKIFDATVSMFAARDIEYDPPRWHLWEFGSSACACVPPLSLSLSSVFLCLSVSMCCIAFGLCSRLDMFSRVFPWRCDLQLLSQ